jgi:hypothetical protein
VNALCRTGGKVTERRNALAEGALLTLIDPPPVDAGLDEELRLAMVIDVLDVDRDCREVGRMLHRLLDDARAASRGERDVALGENTSATRSRMRSLARDPRSRCNTKRMRRSPARSGAETGIAYGP